MHKLLLIADSIGIHEPMLEWTKLSFMFIY